MLLASREMEKKYGLRCANVFHAGDGNLHPLILFDANEPGRAAPRRAVRRRHPGDYASRWAAPSPASTASASRRSTRCACSSAPAELELFHAVKRAFDPAGCSIPARRSRRCARCAEYGRMHVQRRPAAVRRPAALLSHDRSRTSGDIDRASRGTRRARRCASAAAARKDFYGERAARRSRSTRARYAGIVELRADRAGGHGALRHAARRARSGARARQGQCLPFEPPHFGAGATVGGMRRRRLVRAAARRPPARCATSCSARRCSTAAASVLQLRRPGDEERRRLRRVACLAGSLGTLGVILEVSLKVLPLPRSESTLRLEVAQAEALDR